MRCSSCQRSAVESPASTFCSSACASSSCCRARATSISDATIASSTRAIARSSSTWKKPGPVANVWIWLLSMSTYTRVDPAFSIATSGACRASTPISPAAPGTTIISASPSNAGPSGVTSDTENFGCAMPGLRLRQLPAALDGLLDRAHHVERLLRQVVVLAVEDLREAADRVLELHELARRAGELRSGEERLREEALDLAGALHDDLVLVGQLVDAEDGDDVLQVGVALQHLLHTRRRSVVLLPDDPRLQCARGRPERVHRRIDPFLDDAAVEHGGRVEVRESVRRSRVGEVVGGHVDRLHRGDRARACRGDALLQLPHLGRKRRLVADRARHPA